MKNLKKIAMVAMLGVMGFGAYSTYEYVVTTDAEHLMMENVEALTYGETGSGCYQTMGHCSNASGIVQMCTTHLTGEKCWIWITGCKFC